jgi:hypothetical protein
MRGHTVTEEGLRKLKGLINKDKYQPPRRYHNTRPTDNGGGGATIEYVIDSLETKTEGPYTGLIVATVIVKGAPGDREDLIETEVEVVDHSGCIFDEEDMTGYTGWASEMVYLSLDATEDCDTKTPLHWAAINRCCGPDSGNYADPCVDPSPGGGGE